MKKAASSYIEIRGARTHNLQKVDLDIPRGKLTVLTGVSGSGKSSLAFDTLFAEGQRQYLQSLSSYTRQFVDQMERPQVDSIRGLQPSLCIDQHQGVFSPRSTVGTISEIYDFLRLLMARGGIPACHRCGRPIDRQAPSSILASILKLPAGTKLTLLAPMVLSRKGSHADVFERMIQAGLVRAKVDGEFMELEEPPVLAPRREHSISGVVDRVVLRPDNTERIEQAILSALSLTNGLVAAYCQSPGSRDDEGVEHLYSTRYACVECGVNMPELEPRTFSFNSAYGACPKCEGFGHLESPSREPCPACHGARLRPESLAVRFAGKSIAELVSMPLGDCHAWLEQLSIEGDQQRIVGPILKEILPRLQYLHQVGLSYLTLDRPAETLSGGELQRVRLATSVGTGLIGVCYVLDEPSIGLHPRDTQRLIAILRSLQQPGNTVVVVEHDEMLMRAADLLVDIGPGAGRHGGRIVASGSPKQVQKVSESVTGQYLIGHQQVVRSEHRPVDAQHTHLAIQGITKNNLNDVSVRIPLGRLVGITGVSGSGKSTLVHDTLVLAVASHLAGTKVARHWRDLRGLESIDRLIEVDQSPIGRSPRSVPATYVGLWDDIRKIFAATRDAKQRGFAAARFSFNAGPGRCETCAGQGRLKLEMSFLEDVDVPCSTCNGRRFNRATLAVHFKGKNIAQVLDMTVDEAANFFDSFDSLHRVLRKLQDVGLGYITLGQRATTLSGGEAQRLKLANELGRGTSDRTLYVLDEPTTGLHLSDVARLVSVLQGLVDSGHTVVVIEHHMDLIRSCDWVIDLGPEGGVGGGRILGEGPPGRIAEMDTSTGLALRDVNDVT
ncbi:MAG: excinuclease ABC subunit UvrA [Planctomycetota bacterium]